MQCQYGLVGASLAHSFSPFIHGQLGSAPYELLSLSEPAFETLLRERPFKGINVTIPYKRRALALCDALDARAKAIGAVNTVVNQNGTLVGYNTDYDGFAYLAKTAGVDLAGKTLLLLGNGGTTRTVRAVAEAAGAKQVWVASRRPQGESLPYEQAAALPGVQVVVNCSPAGMFPHNDEAPLVDAVAFPDLEAVLDAVYNPLRTRLLQAAAARGVAAHNGLAMLVAQAKSAAELFLGRAISEAEIGRIHRLLLAQLQNVVLIGMPGCGKTTAGKKLAERMGRPFVDVDARIEARAGRTIPALFQQEGEGAFRALETAVVAEVAAGTGQVIATGGGVVKRGENIAALRQNGVLLYMRCPAEALQLSGGRPLAQNREDLLRLEAEREPLYRAAADAVVPRGGDVHATVAALQRAFDAAVAKEAPQH